MVRQTARLGAVQGKSSYAAKAAFEVDRWTRWDGIQPSSYSKAHGLVNLGDGPVHGQAGSPVQGNSSYAARVAFEADGGSQSTGGLQFSHTVIAA